MPLLWALSSTLSISVYNVIRGKSLQLREAWSQATAWGTQEPRVYWSDLERPAGVSVLILTVVEDKLTSWWNHCVWCHKIRVTHWQEFHHQSCSLTLLLTSGNSGFFCFIFCEVVTMTYYCSNIVVTVFQLLAIEWILNKDMVTEGCRKYTFLANVDQSSGNSSYLRL